jgi:dTDP-4-amino-4,6-dideoxygalactose transaminase
VKRSLDDLAVCGGPPEFDEPLHVGRPNIPDRARLLERLGDMLERRWLTNDGPLVREFEQRIADHAGARHCVAVANGTTGLEIAIRALELDGNVIVPAFTFVATAHALRWQRVQPRFADVDRGTHLMDPHLLEELITPDTSAILPVHLWGRACDIDALIDVASRHQLKVLFDASHAFHCTYHGKPLGGCGDATVFSFHATKFINCFEGGAVTTNSDELAERLRSLRNFGFADYDQVDYLGINGKMNEASAAMGLGCLESLDEFVAANRQNFAAYGQGLRDLAGIELLPQLENETSNDQYVVAVVDERTAPLDRDLLVRVLWEENIRARRYFFPGCHRMEPYATELAPPPSLPVTDEICRRVIQFPTGTAVGSEEIRRICEVVQFLFANGSQIRQRLVGEQPGATGSA